MQKVSNTQSVSSILIQVVQELSLAENLNGVMKIVRSAARKIANADGATFVLKENDLCFYADEEAISPLWKGMKFPMKICISGWSMNHKKQIFIPDIYQDNRVPQDSYRPTFVQSLVMTPIRKDNPIGAIGTYWSFNATPTSEQLQALQALADATSVTLKNLETLKELASRVDELEKANQQLQRFTWIVSHDLKEPLRSMSLNLSLLDERMNFKDEESIDTVTKMNSAISQANHLINDLLEVSHFESHVLEPRNVNINLIISNIIAKHKKEIKAKKAKVEFPELPTIMVDPI